mgnify:FL=1|tara:strand:- start:276 stop:827 length:552 start_codon:yes stop_codon:yes gene_type:complete
MSDHLWISSINDSVNYTPKQFKPNKFKRVVHRAWSKSKKSMEHSADSTTVSNALTLATQANFQILSGFATDWKNHLDLMERLELPDPKLMEHIKIYKKLNGMLPFADGDNRITMQVVLQQHYPALDEYYNSTLLPKRKALGLQHTPSDVSVDEPAGKRARAQEDYDMLDLPALVSSVAGHGGK